MTKFDTEYWMTIDGRSESAAQTLPVFNPATRSEFARVPDATRPQLDQAVAAARRAFNSWSVSTLETRRRALNAIADIVEANVEDLIALLTREQGKPRDGAEWEVRGSSVWCREIAKQSLPDEIVEDTPDRRVITRFSPLGVVGGIVPWNFPILIAIWKDCSGADGRKYHHHQAFAVHAAVHAQARSAVCAGATAGCVQRGVRRRRAG